MCTVVSVLSQPSGGKTPPVAAAKAKAAAAKGRASETAAAAVAANAKAQAARDAADIAEVEAKKAALELRLADADVAIAESEAALQAAVAANKRALAAREAIKDPGTSETAPAPADSPKVFDDEQKKTAEQVPEPKGMKPEPAVKAAKATITLKVPEAAKVTFDGSATTGTGTTRTYQTGVLTGAGYYTITVDGVARKVEVRPGASVTEDFTK